MVETLVVLILTYSNGVVMTSKPMPFTECERMQSVMTVLHPKPAPKYRVVKSQCK